MSADVSKSFWLHCCGEYTVLFLLAFSKNLEIFTFTEALFRELSEIRI
jgi:hypothetical protein